METAPPPPSGPPTSLVAPERPQGADDPASRWPPLSAILALVLAVAGSLIVTFVIAALAAVTGASLRHSTAAENLIATFAGDACFVGAALWVAARVSFPRPEQFGLRAPTSRELSVGLVVAGYFVFLVVAGIWTRALHLHQDDKLPKMLGASDSHLALVMVGVLTCVVAPMCEEFLFRGYMFRALRNWHGLWPAALIVGLVFGGVHVASADVGFLAPLALFGVILCLVYEITGSLYPCIALHCLNNSIAFATLEHARVGAGIALLAGALLTITLLLRLIVGRWSSFGRVEPAR